jgi:hypothetical protein
MAMVIRMVHNTLFNHSGNTHTNGKCHVHGWMEDLVIARERPPPTTAHHYLLLFGSEVKMEMQVWVAPGLPAANRKQTWPHTSSTSKH